MFPVWINGSLVDPDAVTVSAFDHGLTVGDGVFETLRTVPTSTGATAPFAATRHLRRLRLALDVLGMRLALTDEDLRDALHAVASGIDGPARLRITVTSGPGPLGARRGDGPPTVCVMGDRLAPWPPTGAAVTVPWTRNPRSATAGVKSTSYGDNVVALAHARAAGASEALFGNSDGELCEGAGSNVFVVHDGVVRTPPLTSGCLAGVTRELVLECTGVREEAMPLDVLATADEIFLTSSTRGVHGQHRIDDRRLPAPGPVTGTVAAAFAGLVAAGVDP